MIRLTLISPHIGSGHPRNGTTETTHLACYVAWTKCLERSSDIARMTGGCALESPQALLPKTVDSWQRVEI
jgi:hypothetical protein